MMATIRSKSSGASSAVRSLKFAAATTPAANANMQSAAAVSSRRLSPKSMATILPNPAGSHSNPPTFFTSLMTRGSAFLSRPIVPPVDLVRLLPTIPEAAVIFDLVEGRVAAAELVPDTLDGGPHIGPIAVGPISGDETLILQPVVDRPVFHVPT